MSRHHPYRTYQRDYRGNRRDHLTLGEDETLTIRAGSSTLDVTKKVVDRHGQAQALLTCSSSGIWSIHSPDNVYAFTVNFDDPSFRNVITSKQPWNIAEWSTPARINILLELLHSETTLSAADGFKFELFRCTRRIVRKFEVLPSSLYLWGLTKEGNNYQWGGGFADIWKGRTANGDPVCLKVLRVFTSEDTKKQLFKEFSEEALVWSQLDHPNVLPFLGTNIDLFSESYCLVSSWCSKGNVMIYLSTHPDTNKMVITWDILKGLEYLHMRKPPVVHGDLKGANILVSDSGECRLADFGLAGMTSTLTISVSAGNGTRGSVRWMAPELFDYEMNLRPSTVTDMYSFGCTVFEIITGSPPFFNVRSDIAVSIEVMKGSRPLRPAEGFSDQLWTAVEKCWVDPKKRHTCKTFTDSLPELFSSVKGACSPNQEPPTLHLLTQTLNRAPKSLPSQLSNDVIRHSFLSSVQEWGPVHNAPSRYEDPSTGPAQPNLMMQHLPFGPPPLHVLRELRLPPLLHDSTTSIPPPQFTLPPIRHLEFRFRSRYTSEPLEVQMFGSVENTTDSTAPYLFASRISDAELAKHYANTVVGLQYVLADKVTLPKILCNAVEKDGFARYGACFLSLIHIQRSSVSTQTALGTPPMREMYKELLNKFSFAKQQFGEDDALAALNVISAFSFDGGHSDWQKWLQVACIYSSHVLEDRTRFHDYRNAVINCSDQERFIIKTTFRYDVLASVTTMNAPNFANAIDTLYNPSNQNSRIDCEESALLSMLPIMGCENRIVWALSRISQLFVWKQALEKKGQLGILELISRAADIEASLAPPSPPLTSRTDEDVSRMLASEVFRTSAIVCLRIIIHGNHPIHGSHLLVPNPDLEIKKAVADVITSLERVAVMPEQVRHAIVQSTVFAFFICAALTTNPNKRSFLLRQLEGESKVRSYRDIIKLLQEIDRQVMPTAISWQKMLHASKVLLV